MKFKNGICFDQSFANHQFDSLAGLLQVNLSEQFFPPVENYVYFIEDFFVVPDLVLNNSCVLYYALASNLA